MYKKPEKRLHRGFVYLNDSVVIDSLSALESGKIDEVVAKVNTLREGGLSGSLTAAVPVVGSLGVEGGKKSTSGYEEEVVRKRTAFSIFESWYGVLVDRKGLGTFEGWGPDALDNVSPGNTVEIRGSVEMVPLQTLFRLYLWFAERAKKPGNMFSQKGEELKSTKDTEQTLRTLLGESDEIIASIVPLGQPGPRVLVRLDPQYSIAKPGSLSGLYNVVGQVEQVLARGEYWPAVRLTDDAPPTPIERTTLDSAVAGFAEAAGGLGIEIGPDATKVEGPAIVISPIAAYR